MLWTAALAVLVTAQPAGGRKDPSVAVVKSSSIPPFELAAAAIVEDLRRHPLQPEILSFDLEGDEAKVASVLEALRRLSPGLIVTVGSFATSAILADASSVPVVFSMVLYPRESGFLSKPSRGVTGASLDVPLDVQFDYVRRLFPGARRVGVLYHPGETGVIVDAARKTAAKQGLSLVARTVDGPADAVGALNTVLEQVDVVWSVADSHVFTPQTTSPLILASLRRGVPVIGLSTAHVQTGSLAALYCDYADVGRQAAELALRVLRGERPEDVPVTAPRKVALALNLRTAKHLGLHIPADLAGEAGEVVQ